MKKLIPALCMLLVAACLMGTSTYAWFAANDTVTASGMSVKAAAEGGLAIASYDVNGNAAKFPALTDFAASATAKWNNQLALTVKTVKPTSTFNGKWWTATSDDANLYKTADTTATAVTVNTPADLAPYAQMTSFVIKSLDQREGMNYALKVKSIGLAEGAAETDSSKALNNALRVAICVTDLTDTAGTEATTPSVWYYFAPFSEGTINTSAATDLTYINESGASTKYTASDKFHKGAISTPVTLLANGLDTIGVRVDVYVYYEGDDASCTSSNIALTVDQLPIVINYTTT